MPVGRAIWGALLAGAACSGPSTRGDPGTTEVRQDTAPGDTGTAPPELAFASPPAVAPNPVRRAPLVQILTVDTTQPTTLEVKVWTGSHRDTLIFDEQSTTHEVPLLGLIPDETFGVRVIAHGTSGSITSQDLVATTPPLPEDTPDFTLDHLDLERIEPGYTLVNGGPQGRFLYALGPQGQVVWTYEADGRLGEFHPLPDGLLRMVVVARDEDRKRGRVVDIDMRGRMVRGWAPEVFAGPQMVALEPGIPVLHHDVEEAPDDGLFVLTIEPIEEPSFPTSETDASAPRAPATLAADVLLELSPDGSVRDSWRVADYIDTQRIGYSSLTSMFWEDHFGGATDWSHANGVFYDAEGDGLLLSLRHQDVVLYLDRATGALEWMLGPPGNWSPAMDALRLKPVDPDFDWFWHQHAPKLLPGNRMLLFDNGNHAAPAYEPHVPAPLALTRVVELAIDPEAGTVEELWSYARKRNPRVFCISKGEAHILPQTGNVLINYGSIYEPADGAKTRLVEVTHTDPPEVVWEVAVRNTSGANKVKRIPSLYL